MLETFDEEIDVGAVFTRRGMRPAWFVWQGRRRMIERVTYAWKALDGGILLRYFTVTDTECVYELCFDPTALRWRLTKIAAEG